MKTNKYFSPVTGFIAGTVFTVSIMMLLSFRAPAPSSPGAGVISVNVQDAHTFVGSYVSGAAPLNQVIKGFAIDRSQLDAMNSLSSQNPGLAGFRIYFGRDNNARPVGIVVGMDGTGKDVVSGAIYSTDAPRLSPCPVVCDVSSPITLGL